jgi:hypothetical protein
MRQTWRAIFITVFLSILMITLAFVTLKAVAQNPVPAGTEQFSADNNVSFPVDI